MTTSRDAPLSHQLLLFAAVWGAIVLFMGVLNVGTRFAVEGGGALAYVGVLLWAWLPAPWTSRSRRKSR